MVMLGQSPGEGRDVLSRNLQRLGQAKVVRVARGIVAVSVGQLTQCRRIKGDSNARFIPGRGHEVKKTSCGPDFISGHVRVVCKGTLPILAVPVCDEKLLAISVQRDTGGCRLWMPVKNDTSGTGERIDGDQPTLECIGERFGGRDPDPQPGERARANVDRDRIDRHTSLSRLGDDFGDRRCKCYGGSLSRIERNVTIRTIGDMPSDRSGASASFDRQQAAQSLRLAMSVVRAVQIGDIVQDYSVWDAVCCSGWVLAF